MKTAVNAPLMCQMKQRTLNVLMCIAQYPPSVYPVPILSSPSVKLFVFHSRFHISRSMGKKHPSHRVWKVHLLHLPLVLFEQTEIPALDIQVPYWVRSVQKTLLKRCDKMGFPIPQQTQGFFHLVRENDDIRIP